MLNSEILENDDFYTRLAECLRDLALRFNPRSYGDELTIAQIKADICREAIEAVAEELGITYDEISDDLESEAVEMLNYAFDTI